MKKRNKKRWKTGVILALAAVLALPPSLSGHWNLLSHVQAETSASRFFYNQLTEKERLFYNAMEEMYASGLLMTGTADYELTAKHLLTQEELQGYADGSPQLLNFMGAARDAFYFDHPDIFYVDFSALSLRVTRDSAGTYRAYLGTGRREDYYTEGFTSQEQVKAAAEEYENAVNTIVKAAQEMHLDPGMDRMREQITYVHNTIARQTSYKLEDKCSPANIGFIRTAYGALVKGESVCEGYARAMKSVMDRLGIPCVLVQGVYRHTSENVELHMWNYVQVDGQWYGVDVTMDDPIGDGRENSEYLLVGDDILGAHHIPSGIVSPANREFTYPPLSQSGLGFYQVADSNGLLVEYLSGAEDGDASGVFRVSYNGMGYAEAAKAGKYILARFYQYYPGTDEYSCNDWAYADPSIYDLPQEEHALIFPAPHLMYAEFAVTDMAPSGTFLSDGKIDKDYWYYKGDPLLFEAYSGKIYNPNGTYVAPPYPQANSPSTQGRIYMGEPYDMSITYDDKLVETGTEEVGYVLTSSGSTGVQYSKVENFHWDGDRTITFRFTPSPMYADESVLYTFRFTGLVGERSRKAPIEMNYVSSSRCAVCAYHSQGYDWNIFGQPSLLENSDLSMSGWQTSDGSEVSELLKNRLALVVTKPEKAQADTMEQLIDQENGTEVLASETYNISLTLCKKQIVRTGQGVRVSVGFPAGYGPDDEGVTFKAYHFKRNDAGQVTGVEEIGCVVTRFGLIITCDAFSPFAIVAVKDDGSARTTDRTAILSGTSGGTVSSDKGSLFQLKENESAAVTVKADPGYAIEQITVNGAARSVTDSKNMTFTLNYGDLHDTSDIIDVKFIAETVLQHHQEQGESSVDPAPEAIVLAYEQQSGHSPAPQTQAPADTPAPQTQAPADTPAPQTQAPADTPAPPTQAPVVTPAPQTQAPASTPAPQAQAPANTPAPQTQTPANTPVPQTQAPASTTVPQEKLPATATPAASVSTRPSGSTSVASSHTGKSGSAVITFASPEITLAVGETLSIDPIVELPVGINSYQWYKDDAALAGQTSRSLVIESVTAEDAGLYRLCITSIVSDSTYNASSDDLKVLVTEASAAASPESDAGTETPPETADPEDVIISPSGTAPEGSESGHSPVLLIIVIVLALAAVGGILFYVAFAGKKR